MTINQRCPLLSQHMSRWTTSRDVIGGTYHVRAKPEVYLPLAFAGQDAASYRRYLKQVSFYPAANRTADGIVGLMMRRDPVMETTGLLKEIKNVITSQGDSVEELARQVCREVLTTNYCGLLTDYPSGGASSLGAAIEEGIRPFVNLYRAENILECKPGVVRNKRVPVRIRLQDDDCTIRLLELRGGRVVVKVYRTDPDGVFPTEDNPSETHEPKANGQPLTEIPFDLITTDNSFTPSGAPLDNVVSLNLDHYVMSGALTTHIIFGISPMLFISGIEGKEGDTLTWAPGAIYTSEKPEARAQVLSVPADAAVPIEHVIQATEDRLAATASRILARQKNVAEAAETEAVRQGAENSVLAMIANTVSAHMERALARVSDFTDGAEVRFQINTDYLPSSISPQEITALLGLRKSNEISAKSLFYKLRDGGVFNETLTFDEEQKRIAEIQAAITPAATPDPLAPAV